MTLFSHNTCLWQILEESNNTGFGRAVHFPKEASEKAVNRNGSFSGVLLFPDIPEVNSKVYLIIVEYSYY